jgi:hypothetical protein
MTTKAKSTPCWGNKREFFNFFGDYELCSRPWASACSSASVQVFGCLHDEAIHTRQQQASEKRRGTKSRGARNCGGSNLTAGYGDLKGTPVAAGAQHIGASGRFGRF